MSFLWTPPTRAVTGTQVPHICHVLYEYDGPKMVIAIDEAERQVLGVAVDEQEEGSLTRWLFAQLTPEAFAQLLEGTRTLRDLFTAQPVQVVDVDRGWTSISAWNVDGNSLPDELLPEADAALPEFTPEFRARLVAEQSHKAKQHLRLAQTRLFFDGKPVVGRRAINVDFAVDALGRYQNLVSVAYGARVHGELSSRGRIPEREASTLCLASMPRGSVGFELVEAQEQTLTQPSLLSEVVAEVGELIDAAASNDNQFADAIAEFDPRVYYALRDFFGTINKAEASFRLEVKDRQYTFDVERVRLAAERTIKNLLEEQELPVLGTLLGYLPAARRFEFRNEDNEVLYGKISREMRLQELPLWVGVPCIAHMHIVTVKRKSGETQTFTLLGMTHRP